MSVNDFRKEWDAEVDELLKQVSGAVTKTGLYGWNLVTAATPVLTGRARASWLLTVDSIENKTLPKVKGRKRVYGNPSSPKVTFDITQAQYMYITNNVEYIEYLEDGTNKITPFAMVAMATPKIDRELQRRLKRIK